jgi:hypothetical protein
MQVVDGEGRVIGTVLIPPPRTQLSSPVRQERGGTMWNHESLAPITPGGRRSGQQLHPASTLSVARSTRRRLPRLVVPARSRKRRHPEPCVPTVDHHIGHDGG